MFITLFIVGGENIATPLQIYICFRQRSVRKKLTEYFRHSIPKIRVRNIIRPNISLANTRTLSLKMIQRPTQQKI